MGSWDSKRQGTLFSLFAPDGIEIDLPRSTSIETLRSCAPRQSPALSLRSLRMPVRPCAVGGVRSRSWFFTWFFFLSVETRTMSKFEYCTVSIQMQIESETDMLGTWAVRYLSESQLTC